MEGETLGEPYLPKPQYISISVFSTPFFPFPTLTVVLPPQNVTLSFFLSSVLPSLFSLSSPLPFFSLPFFSLSFALPFPLLLRPLSPPYLKPRGCTLSWDTLSV